MDINLLLQIDDLAVDLNKSLKPTDTIQNAVGFIIANTNDGGNVKLAIRPRTGNITAPEVEYQNPTLNIDERTRYMQVCLSTMPPYTETLAVDCTDTQSDIAFEIDKTKTYLVSVEGEEYRSVSGSELYSELAAQTVFDTYSDTKYPAYVNEIFCMPTDLGFMYDNVNATNNDTGMILRYQVDDEPVKTFVTNTNLDLPNVDSAKFFQLFANELNALNLGPAIRLKVINLNTNVAVQSGSQPYNMHATVYTGNMGLLELGQSAGLLQGVESSQTYATSVTLRLHVYKDTTFNGVGIKGKNGNTKGYVDMYPLLFGTVTEFVEVNSCGTSTVI